MIVSALLFSATLMRLPVTPSCVRHTVEVRVPTRAGHVLAGWLSVPRQPRRITAVLIGGAGESARDYSTDEHNHAYPMLADSLACAGVASFRFDEVGVGASTGSYNKYATTRTLANDVQDLVTWLADTPDTRRDRVVLVGHSEGGAIAGLVASEDRRVAGLVLLAAPVRRGDTIIAYQSAARLRDGESAASVADRARRRAARGPWYAYFLQYDPAPAYAKLTQPVLILQGGADWLVTPDQADSIARLLRSSGNTQSACVRFAGLSHSFNGDAPVPTFDPRVLRAIVVWTSATPAATVRPGRPGACVEQ